MRIGVLNAGSSTLKSALVECSAKGIAVDYRVTRTWKGEQALGEAFDEALDALAAQGLDATAHRVVHGGSEFIAPTAVDEPVERSLEALTPWAPLHNPPALVGIRRARRRLAPTPTIAVFDTAFHAMRPLASRLYALPWDLSQRLSLRRYGFHGLAHASLVESLARARRCERSAIDAVTLQLGSGCSACAVQAGRSLETSMGFSPLEGLPMATRAGDVDASLVLYLLRQGFDADELERLLNRSSGLAGLAGSSDLREILSAERAGGCRSALAMTLFVHRIVMTLGAYLTLLDGSGSIVFGGGMGTHSAPLRARVAAGLRAWNVELDAERNASGEMGLVSKPGRREVWVFETDEEPLIAREACALLENR